MERFHIIDDGACILFSKGVYRQAKVYHRGADIYAGYGAGFIKLGSRTGTSNPNVAWYGIEAEGVVVVQAQGQPRFADAATKIAA